MTQPGPTGPQTGGTPQVAGPQGQPGAGERATRAWTGLVKAMSRDVPREIQRSKDARRRMLRGRR